MPSLRQAQLRHARYYADVLRIANKLYQQGGESIKKGLDLFDIEWSNIQAGQNWSQENSNKDKAAAELCNIYPNACDYLMELRVNPKQQIFWRETALGAARLLSDRDAEGQHLGELGVAYFLLGEVHP